MTLQQQHERSLVRELARQVAEVAASDENERIMRRWRDVNALHQPDRAPVWCRPVGAWAEILPESALGCRDPWLRAVEYRLRRTLIKHEIGDDSPVEGTWDVPSVLAPDPPNVWSVDVCRRVPGEAGGAWAYDPPLREEGDFSRLRRPRFAYDAAQTKHALSMAHDLLGDLLPVRRICVPPLGATLCTPAAELRGLEQGCRQLQGYRYQIVLRELQTLAGHPDRLRVWTRLAQEAAAKYA